MRGCPLLTQLIEQIFAGSTPLPEGPLPPPTSEMMPPFITGFESASMLLAEHDAQGLIFGLGPGAVQRFVVFGRHPIGPLPAPLEWADSAGVTTRDLIQHLDSLSRLDAVSRRIEGHRVHLSRLTVERDRIVQRHTEEHQRQSQTLRRRRHLRREIEESGTLDQKVRAALKAESQADGREKKRENLRRREEITPIRSEVARVAENLRLDKLTRASLTSQIGQLWKGVADRHVPEPTSSIIDGLIHLARHGIQPTGMYIVPEKTDEVEGGLRGFETDFERMIQGICMTQHPRVTRIPCDFHGAAPPILFEDDYYLIVDKPSGLISTPGRHWTSYDSALSRAQATVSPDTELRVTHRLDQETSGVMVFAKSKEADGRLSSLFQGRAVAKYYEAQINGDAPSSGMIDLPLARGPNQRPTYEVCRLEGKTAQTRFKVIDKVGPLTRLELCPVTGRTHQLRIHCAAPEGLWAPIVGDELYGDGIRGERLHLHARQLNFLHPFLNEPVQVVSEAPF